MKTRSDIYEIITLSRHGWTIREIATELEMSPTTVIKYKKDYEASQQKLQACPQGAELHQITEELSEEPKYNSRARKARRWTKELDQMFHQILAEEERKDELLGKGHKLRMTAKRMHGKLVTYGYEISYSTVCKKLREYRIEHAETFIKQEYDYGYRFEFDFGERQVIINGKKQKVYMAVIALPASGYRDYYIYTNCRKEVFQDALVRFFERIGGTLQTGVFDNMKNVVKKFVGPHERQLTDTVIRLAGYYNFEVVLTNPRRGNEKGTVEDFVRWTFEELFTEKYEFDSFEQLLDYGEDQKERINAKSEFEEEKPFLGPYCPPMETACIREQKVDKYSFIRVDGNDYSVPEELTGKTVTVRIYPNSIEVGYRGKMVLETRRLSGKGRTKADIRHYLRTLLKKPGALDNSAALKNVPELKNLYREHYTNNPREFLEILMDNKDRCTVDELIELLRPENRPQRPASGKVQEKAIQQVMDISGLFVGGMTRAQIQEKNREEPNHEDH